MNVYETIKKMRKSKGFTQALMAERLNFTTSNYTLLENGKTEMTISKLEKLAEVFGVSVGELLGLEVAGSAPNGEQASEIEGLKEKIEALQREVKDLREMKDLQSEKIAYYEDMVRQQIEKLPIDELKSNVKGYTFAGAFALLAKALELSIQELLKRGENDFSYLKEPPKVKPYILKPNTTEKGKNWYDDDENAFENS